MELDEFARHRSTTFGMEQKRPYGDGVVTGFGTDRRPARLRVQPGRHRVRRQPRPGLRGEDRQDHRLRPQDRLPADRDQRGRRGADPGGRRLPRSLRGDLPPQHPRLRGDPADLADHGRRRRRPRLLPRPHRLRGDGRPDVADVHHRTRRDQDRHRRGRHDGGAGRCSDPQHPSGNSHYLAADEADAIDYVRALLSYLPQNNLEDPPVFDDHRRPRQATTPIWPWTPSSRTPRTSRTTCTR